MRIAILGAAGKTGTVLILIGELENLQWNNRVIALFNDS
jgi:hypothetical protein